MSEPTTQRPSSLVNVLPTSRPAASGRTWPPTWLAREIDTRFDELARRVLGAGLTLTPSPEDRP